MKKTSICENWLGRLLITVALAVLACGPMMACSSSTTITSEPAGAKVRLDGSPIGQTPANYSEGSVWLWTKHTVTLEKKGYNSTTGQIAAQVNAPMMVIGIIGFLFCLFPGILALVGEYRPQYHFMLTRKEAADATQAVKETAQVQFSQ